MCEEVYEVKGQLDSAVKDNNDELVLAHLRKVAAMTITPSDLEETKIGVTMSTLRKSSSNAEISALAKELIKRWKSLLVAQASADGAATVGKKRKIDGADEHAGKDEDESVKRARYFSENADEEDAGGQADEEVGGKMKAPAWFKESDFKTEDKIRNTVRKKFYDYLGSEFFPVELDRLYCAYAIETGLTDLYKEVNQAYKDKSREILFNLRDQSNASFNAKLADGTMDPFSVASLSGLDLWSEQARKELESKIKYDQEARRSDWQREQNRKNAKPGMFWCGKCKKNKTTYYQLQTRGADEPMTTFVTCLNCGNRWRF
eukprot:TRINITY_DN763_c0_g1_i2.p1 TRINITY_DN763_c0_g1~~TRINITY_DN763_c0_g1_i2.p1  ORF type:complete len:318 (+),score=82.58 TRINITY_DN763_c0_g1_i2:46-999(+)